MCLPLHAADRGKARVLAARHAEVAAVDVDRVRHTELGHGIGERDQIFRRGVTP